MSLATAKKTALGLFFFFLLISAYSRPTEATVTSVESDSYKITWPNLNSGSGTPSAGTYNLGVTVGQNAPGLYEGASTYDVRGGFQYIHSIVPFTFSISKFSVDFGSLTPLTASTDTIGLSVSIGSAGGYSIKAQENNALTSSTSSTIIDTTCDTSCDENTADTWTQSSTYGFGFNMAGDDIPADFSGGKYRQFASTAESEDAVEIMGNTPAGSLTPGDKSATMTLKINVSGNQEAGTYENIITFIALPIY